MVQLSELNFKIKSKSRISSLAGVTLNDTTSLTNTVTTESRQNSPNKRREVNSGFNKNGEVSF